MKYFPNGFSNWCETYFEIVQAITIQLQKDELSDKIGEIYNKKGYGGMYELAEMLTDKFENQYQGKEWDGEYFDAIEEFINEHL